MKKSLIIFFIFTIFTSNAYALCFVENTDIRDLKSYDCVVSKDFEEFIGIDRKDKRMFDRDEYPMYTKIIVQNYLEWLDNKNSIITSLLEYPQTVKYTTVTPDINNTLDRILNLFTKTQIKKNSPIIFLLNNHEENELEKGLPVIFYMYDSKFFYYYHVYTKTVNLMRIKDIKEDSFLDIRYIRVKKIL